MQGIALTSIGIYEFPVGGADIDTALRLPNVILEEWREPQGVVAVSISIEENIINKTNRKGLIFHPFKEHT